MTRKVLYLSQDTYTDVYGEIEGSDSNLNERSLTPLTVFVILIALFIVSGNCLLIFSILRPKNREKLGAPTNIFVSQLSMAGLLVGRRHYSILPAGQNLG